MTQSGAITPGQRGPESDGNEEVLCIPQSSSITGTSPLDYLVLYTGHSLGMSYPSNQKQSVYSTAPAHRAISVIEYICKYKGVTSVLIWMYRLMNKRSDLIYYYIYVNMFIIRTWGKFYFRSLLIKWFISIIKDQSICQTLQSSS